MRALWAVMLATFQASCGYSMGSGMSDRGVHTVFLHVAGNETWRQRLEVDLTRALARELPVSTGLLPASESEASAVLRVDLIEERERTLVPGSRQDPVREGAQEVVVRVRLSRRDGSILVDRELTDRVEFRSPVGEDLSSARRELVDELARKIADSLGGGF